MLSLSRFIHLNALFINFSQNFSWRLKIFRTWGSSFPSRTLRTLLFRFRLPKKLSLSLLKLKFECENYFFSKTGKNIRFTVGDSNRPFRFEAVKHEVVSVCLTTRSWALFEYDNREESREIVIYWLDTISRPFPNKKIRYEGQCSYHKRTELTILHMEIQIMCCSHLLPLLRIHYG